MHSILPRSTLLPPTLHFTGLYCGGYPQTLLESLHNSTCPNTYTIRRYHFARPRLRYLNTSLPQLVPALSNSNISTISISLYVCPFSPHPSCPKQKASQHRHRHPAAMASACSPFPTLQSIRAPIHGLPLGGPREITTGQWPQQATQASLHTPIFDHSVYAHLNPQQPTRAPSFQHYSITTSPVISTGRATPRQSQAQPVLKPT